MESRQSIYQSSKNDSSNASVSDVTSESDILITIPKSDQPAAGGSGGVSGRTTTEVHHYQTGDVILQQGHVISVIIKIRDGQKDCIKMTRTYEDGEEEIIGFLSGGDYVGLLYYTGFNNYIFPSVVTYTCMKDDVVCDIVHCSTCESAIEYICGSDGCEIVGGNNPLRNEQLLKKKLQREIFKVVPGFCKISYKNLDFIINSTGKSKVIEMKEIPTYTNENVQDDILIQENSKTDLKFCYIILNGYLDIASPTNGLPRGQKNSIRQKEPLELFGEAYIRNPNASRNATVYNNSGKIVKVIKIDLSELSNSIKDDYNKVVSDIRYRGNNMELKKILKSSNVNFNLLVPKVMKDSST